MKILCYVNHYFGEALGFEGGSTTNGVTEHRKAVVIRCLEALRVLPGAQVEVCGTDGRSLVPVDLDFPLIRDRPRLLVYESLAHMARRANDDYDYFINIEDDILVPLKTFENVVEFDRDSTLSEVLLPNRLERRSNGELICPDLRWMPGWTYQQRRHRGRHIRVALNPHSGLLILSRDKFRYALRHVDTAYRGRLIGAEMSSAYATYHGPFSLYRFHEGLSSHAVIHEVAWAGESLVANPDQAELAPTLDVMLAQQRDHVAALEAALVNARTFRSSVLASLSWRVTAPAREAGRRVRGLANSRTRLRDRIWPAVGQEGWRKEVWYLYFRLVYQMRLRTRRKRRLPVGPGEVKRHYTLWKVAHLLGVELVRSTDHAASLAVRFHDATISTVDAPFADRVLNGNCTDISKRRVEIASLAVLGYGAAVDPTKHIGQMVEKSDQNAVHDGMVIKGPIKAPDPSKIYQRLLDNGLLPGFTEDLRVTIVAGRVALVMRARRPTHDRFGIAAHSELVATNTVLSSVECIQIGAFADHMSLDMGEMDVVRDRTDGRVYVVDVNNTPTAPTPVGHTFAGIRSMHRVARAFEREWGALLQEED